MASQLGKRTTSKTMSTANRDRALARIERELKAIIENSPIVHSVYARGDVVAGRGMTCSTLGHWHLLSQSIKLLWP